MKKKKFMTRIVAVVFAIAILFAMSIPAFADDTTTDEAGSAGSNANITIYTDDGQTKTYTMKKIVVVFNTDGSTVREPSITFSYAATPGAANASVFDGRNTVKTLAGVNENNITFSDAVYSNDMEVENAAINGTAVEKTVTISIPDNMFSVAGIYRYVITETSNPNDVSLAGLTTRTTAYKTIRYMDVYVSNKTN